MTESTGKHILIVDDEPHNVKLLNGMLRSLGHLPVAAASGEEALQLVDGSIDLVLLDALMPGTDGFETARALRRTYSAHELPIIMVTVLQRREDRLSAVQAGANDFITKPVELIELKARTESLLRMKEAYDELRQHRDDLEDEVEARTAALVDTELRFKAFFDSSTEGLFIKDTDLKYTNVNAAMLEVLGCDETEIIGSDDDSLFEPDRAGRNRKLETRALKGQVTETRHDDTVGGRRVTYSCLRLPLRDRSGNVTGLCGMVRDVSIAALPVDRPDRLGSPYSSPAMRSTLKQVDLAADTDSIVLFLGESGSGKDFLARRLHDRSPRCNGPFFSINCAALSRELAESELFGHEKGSFTGAVAQKRGLVELAEGGTLLLNEIGELEPALQAKLLTFLDTGSFTRVGGRKQLETDVRIIAATNRDLEQEIAEGGFREDLFHRLNVFTVRVPPLRQRKEDIPKLVHEIAAKLSEKQGREIAPVVDEDAVKTLIRYDWPGNVRELRNVLERALILSNGQAITTEQIRLSEEAPPQTGAGDLSVSLKIDEGCSMDTAFREAKRYLVDEALRATDGNVVAAARLLGISRDKLRYHLRHERDNG